MKGGFTMPKLTYLSHSAFLMENAGTSVAIDPFLTGNPLAPIRAEDIHPDWIILTHGHGDHVGDGIKMAKRDGSTIIAPFELATYCEMQGAQVHAMYIGGAHQFPFGRVKMTIAHHGSSVIDGNTIIYTGNPVGILLTMGGSTLYHPGDTGLFYDMKLIGEMNSIDVAVLPIGDNFTMGIADAVKAVEFLKPGLAIPMHYNTFDVIKADPNEFVQKVRDNGYNAQVLGFGETLEF